MNGITTGTRLERLERLERQVHAEVLAERHRTATGDHDTGPRPVPLPAFPAPKGGDCPDHSTRAARTWARGQGIDVGSRGKVPAELIADYHRAHGCDIHTQAIR